MDHHPLPATSVMLRLLGRSALTLMRTDSSMLVLSADAVVVAPTRNCQHIRRANLEIITHTARGCRA